MCLTDRSALRLWSAFSLLPFLPADCCLLYQDNFLASFLLGWGITIGAGLASYPIDTVRRRMMMTSGQAVKYKSSIDCFQQVRLNPNPCMLRDCCSVTYSAAGLLVPVLTSTYWPVMPAMLCVTTA